MIGDWVRMKKHPEATFQMEDVSGTELFKRWTADGEYMLPYSYSEIEPIPLTPEILEKNGFVYNDMPFAQSWEQFGLALYLGGDGYRINCGQNVAMIIDSVHELQHALRLCGIDKNIEI